MNTRERGKNRLKLLHRVVLFFLKIEKLLYVFYFNIR